VTNLTKIPEEEIEEEEKKHTPTCCLLLHLQTSAMPPSSSTDLRVATKAHKNACLQHRSLRSTLRQTCLHHASSFTDAGGGCGKVDLSLDIKLRLCCGGAGTEGNRMMASEDAIQSALLNNITCILQDGTVVESASSLSAVAPTSRLIFVKNNSNKGRLARPYCHCSCRKNINQQT
jgi:hypothetical protein